MNLPHFIQPIVTNPTVPGGTQTGLGGFEFYNFSMVKVHGTKYGAGPLVVAPNESNTHFGSEKWQAGFAAVASRATNWGILGGILTYQHSFGRGAGPITQEVTFQPQTHYKPHDGFFLQSEGLMDFNSGHGVRAVPIGLGLGKVWSDAAGRAVTIFLEPDYSVWRRGAGAPTWQLFGGVNVQLPGMLQFGTNEASLILALRPST